MLARSLLFSASAVSLAAALNIPVISLDDAASSQAVSFACAECAHVFQTSADDAVPSLVSAFLRSA